jgi:ATP-dependent Clp protease adaptor protein ClpS
MPLEKPEQISDPEIEEETDVDLECRVILFNDDWHTFDEVIDQLMKAINCSFDVARGFAFEVHVRGKAVVFTGDLQKCLRVSSVLEEIALHTQIVS